MLRPTAVVMSAALVVVLFTAYRQRAFSGDDYAIRSTVAPHPRRHHSKHATAQDVVFFSDGSDFDDLVALLFILKSERLNLLAIYIGPNGWANGAPSRRIFRDILYMYDDRYASIPIFMGNYYALADKAAAVAAGHPHAIVPYYRAPIPFGPIGLVARDDAFGAARLLPRAPYHSDLTAPTTDDASLVTLAALLRGRPAASVLFFATGPLTPLSQLFIGEHVALAERDILPAMRGVVAMGGAVHLPGNLKMLPGNDRAESNIYTDPHAADIVLRGLAARDLPGRLIPLDATRFVPLSKAMLTQIVDSPPTPGMQLAGVVLRNLAALWGPSFETEAFLWDAAAAVSVAHPDAVLNERRTPLRVVTEQGPEGRDQGWTKPCDLAEIDAGLCYDVDVVLELNTTAVEHYLVTVLRSSVNSAQRPLDFS